MLLIDIRSTNASAAEFILYRLKLYLAGRHRHHTPSLVSTTSTHQLLDDCSRSRLWGSAVRGIDSQHAHN